MADRRYTPLGKAPFKDGDETITGFWKYTTQFAVNTQGQEWWWWNGFYVEATDPAYTNAWSMAEDSGGSAAYAALSVAAFSSSAEPDGPSIDLYRSRGLSGTPAATQSGDFLGDINWYSMNGVSTGTAPFNTITSHQQARISVYVDQDRTATGTNYEDVSMYFSVADGVDVKNVARLKDRNLVLSKDSGHGIQVDLAAPTFGWRDITGAPQEPTTAVGRPSFAAIGTTGVSTWSYGIGEYQTYHYHVPHDYVPGTDIHFHVHWFGPQTAGGYTKWQFDFLYAQGFDQAAFSLTTATTTTAEQQQSTTAGQHMIAETIGITIPNLEVDGLIICKVSRIAATGGTDVSGDVFVPTVDIHYQSSNMATKQKAPNFYT